MSHTVPPSSLGSYPLAWRVPKSLLHLCRLPVYMRVEVVMMVLSLYSRMGAIERREEQETRGCGMPALPNGTMILADCQPG